jgi:hypothetical protein
MRYTLFALVHNLSAGARLALFRRVDRAAFRVDIAQWLLLVIVSAVVDVALDAARAGPGAVWSFAGVDGELFALGELMLVSALIAGLARDPAVFLGLPIVVLAAFPILQVLHAVPAMLDVPWPEVYQTAFDLVMLAWMMVVCMRAVRVISDTPVRRRMLRAVAGGLLVSAPLWFEPLAGPLDRWWTPPDVQDPDNATSPASEPVMAAQAFLLDRAIDALEDSRAGIADLYFVGFAPDARRDGFRQELDEAQRVLDERFGTSERSMLLLNNRATVAELPFATLTNLRRVLVEIGDTIDPDEDIVMLYLAAGSTQDHGLAAVHPPLELVALTPEGLKQLLDNAGIRFRVIVVSTCAAGAWLDALQDDDTAVMVSARDDTQPAGCEGGAEPSSFSTALFEHALRSADDLPAAFGLALRELAPSDGSGPELRMGAAIEGQLKRITRGKPTRRAAAENRTY